MANSVVLPSENHDFNAERRKSDHIKLAFESSVESLHRDTRFNYEPLLSGHHRDVSALEIDFLGKTFGAPIWVSSMTGGTALAKTINQNLARMCGQYKLGMGLGSCRQILTDDTFLQDFSVRKWIGDQPLYANLGIAQVDALVQQGKYEVITNLVKKLEADGLIIHINPLQEWLQPEGDRYYNAPTEILAKVIDHLPNLKIIVKEVGQGMGPKSIAHLLQLPLEAIDFGALGGTNFSSLEILRSEVAKSNPYQALPLMGHDADQMVDFVNAIVGNNSSQNCNQVIISGGVKDFLDGYYYTQRCKLPSIYGHAASFLRHATESYELLQVFIEEQIQGLALANSMFEVNQSRP
jgi:isopentenyl-diphosphate Delta-isomerase